VHQREELHGLGERSPEKWVIFGKLLSKINWLLLSVSVVNRGQLKLYFLLNIIFILV
jgi:hypothetical protein